MVFDRLKAYVDTFPFRTRLLFGVMLLYLFYFVFRAWSKGNEEFFYYAAVLFLLFFFVFFYYHELKLSSTLLAGMAAMGLFHFLGGAVIVNGTRLYDLWLLHLGPVAFRYDNFVHAFGVFVLTFLAYHLLRPHFTIRRPVSIFHFAFLLFLVVMGIGAVSEVVELSAVVWLGADGVGDYFNNAFDLVFNGIGSLAACFLIARYERSMLKEK
jgi:hypothetical protein